MKEKITTLCLTLILISFLCNSVFANWMEKENFFSQKLITISAWDTQIEFSGIEKTSIKNESKFNSNYSNFYKDDWFVMSQTNLLYQNEIGENISILVQLRTPINELKKYKANESSGFSKKGNTVYSSSFWELVVEPGQSDEFSLHIDDWGGFVENTKHDGTLFNQSFFNDEEVLFLYFLNYSSSNNEALFLYYYDKSSGKLSNSNFKYKSGQTQESCDVSNDFIFGDNNLKKITTSDCSNSNLDCPIGSLKTCSIIQGEGQEICQLWGFDKMNNIFTFKLSIVSDL